MLMWYVCRSCSERVHLSSCEPSELCKLQGHRHDVLLLQVSHDSMAIATGSKDGCVRVSSVIGSSHGAESLSHFHLCGCISTCMMAPAAIMSLYLSRCRGLHSVDIARTEVLTGSQAVTVGLPACQIWRRQVRGRVVGNMWASSLVLSCPIDDEAAAAARRRRRAPPNPSINQVAWTTDDAKASTNGKCLKLQP